jgi:hypothetical protein
MEANPMSDKAYVPLKISSPKIPLPPNYGNSDPGLKKAQLRRLRSESVNFTLHAGPDGKATHSMTLCLAYDGGGVLHELNIVSRGKIGHGLDLALHDLGIRISRAIQGRNPDTGEML